MRTEVARPAVWALVVLALMVTLVSANARATEPVDVTVATELRSIRFEGAGSLPEARLRAVLQTRSRGAAHGLRVALGALPLVPPPARHPLVPRVLAEDVVRLRRAYRDAGFLEARIRYELRQVGDQDLYDLTFVVDEGRPQRVAAAAVVSADSTAGLPVPAGEIEAWTRLEAEIGRLVGGRLDLPMARDHRRLLRDWWRDRGFPDAEVRGSVEQDSLGGEGRLLFTVTPGARRRFGPLAWRGNGSVPDGVLSRELSLRPGDVYREASLTDARRDLQRLPIIRAAHVGTGAVVADPADAHADSLVPLTITVAEAKPRSVFAQLGYVTDAGLSGEARWSHRNFTGGARVFTVTAFAQTGLLAAALRPDVRHRGSISLEQPYLLRRGLSGVVSPFVEYREDTKDRSLQIGSNFTLVRRLSDRLSGSLDYQIATRRIYEYRFDELTAGETDLYTFLTRLAAGETDSIGSRLRTSLVTLSLTAQTLDDVAKPRRGVLIRPSLQVTAPTGAATNSYWRADCSAYAFVPVTRRITLAGRMSAGRLFPFGKSLPGDPLTSSLRLYDATFTAGGTSDVRGWAHRMLGPKYPDLRVTQSGDSLSYRADGYVPLGGFSRWTFTLEARLPLPGFGPTFGSHLFLDGGRVWTADGRFVTGDDSFGQERMFYAAGAGVDIWTPVGAIRLSVGYKLNPSLTDLVTAGDYVDALVSGRPLEAETRHQSHRWQVNLAIGASY